MVLVSGLKENYLSIGQLCDSQQEVQFSLNECIIVDNKGKNVLHGKRTSYNCYVVATDNDLTCHFARISDIDLWHQRLGDVNHKDLENLAKDELVRGLPKCLRAPNSVCGLCQMIITQEG